MKIRLCDEDRELFGCDEWLEWSPLNISINDLDELSGRFGFAPDEWPEPFYGPEGAKPPWRGRATIWMLLRQNGHKVSWEDAGQAHPMLSRVEVELVEAPDSSPPPKRPRAKRSTTK